jgi:hypothetical protein
MRKFVTGARDFLQGLALLVITFAAQGALYVVALLVVAVLGVGFFYFLSFLPEVISNTVLAGIEALGRVARIGVRD